MSNRLHRILIVDDEPDMRDLLEIALAGAFEVTVASGGQDAIDKASNSEFDAIVLDLMMPKIDGEAVVRRLRERGSTTPIVLISAVSDVRQRARELGVFDGERKPVGIPRLQSLIEQAIATGGDASGSPGSGGGPPDDPADAPPASALPAPRGPVTRSRPRSWAFGGRWPHLLSVRCSTAW